MNLKLDILLDDSDYVAFNEFNSFYTKNGKKSVLMLRGLLLLILVAFVTVFFWVCGTCTALILWQAKRVLDTILAEEPFQMSNALALKRAANCCWIISGGALVRLILWFWLDGTIYPLFTYTALFIPAFFMAGLLFMVMSALFRQAAELKEDQDLTI